MNQFVYLQPGKKVGFQRRRLQSSVIWATMTVIRRYV